MSGRGADFDSSTSKKSTGKNVGLTPIYNIEHHRWIFRV